MLKKVTGLYVLFLLTAFSVQAQEVTVEGVVTNKQTQEPLPKVNILVRGTSIGTTTNASGHYSLQVPSLSDTLVFTFIGYESQVVPINGRTTINVTMQPKTVMAEELVVIGFGKKKKGNLTNSVTVIKPEDFQTAAVQNVGAMLQGVVPGLSFTTDGLGGTLNNTMSFSIRGIGSLNTSGAPLVLVDGMAGSLNYLNPNDIKSITVLKGPAAAAVYGSRAAFGVILVTTKDGRAGEMVVSYSNNFRFTGPRGLPEMMNSHSFAMYFNEAAINGGQPPKFDQATLERIRKYQKGLIDYGTVPGPNGDNWLYYTGSNANTAWFDVMYKDYSFSQTHNFSVNGGSKKMTYYFSGSYVDESGLNEFSDDHLNRYTLTAKLDMDLNEYMQLDISSRWVREDYAQSSYMSGLYYHNIARRWPTVPVRDPNGYFTLPSEINQLTEGGRQINQADALYLQGELLIEPLEEWTISAAVNYKTFVRNQHFDVLSAYANKVNGERYPIGVGFNPPGYSYVYEYNYKANFINIDVVSNYRFDVGTDHHFHLMAGFNSELKKQQSFAASRTGLITRRLPTINTATQNSRARGGGLAHWATAGFFGRLDYNYKSRYLLQVTGRIDGSSRFWKGQKWSFFPSVSAGWDVAQEVFWPFKDLISQFKLRAAYGALGNQDTDNWYPFYQEMPIYVNSGSWLINGENPTVAYMPGLISRSLTWETVKSLTVGLDVSMLDNRLGFTFDVFRRKTLHMIGPAPSLPAVLGTAVPPANNAALQTSGFELSVNWNDQIDEDFSYSIRATLSDSRTKILEYPNPTGYYADWNEGQYLHSIWGFTTVGIARTDQQMQEHLQHADQSRWGSNWGAGDIMYKDINGDGAITAGDLTLGNMGDYHIIGNAKPRYKFGLDINVGYRNFDFRIFFQGVLERDYMVGGPYFWGAVGSMWQSAGFVSHMDFFRGPNSYMVKQGFAEVNKDAYFPKPYFGSGKNHYNQTRYIQNAAYVQIQNVQIGYSLPSEILNTLGLRSMRVYVSGQNLYTFTPLFDVFIPAQLGLAGWNTGKTYPFHRVFSFGLQLQF